MSYTYCKDCGHKNLYATQVPKFCGNCGEPLGQMVAAASQVASHAKKAPARKKRTRPMMEEGVEEISEDFSDVDNVPEIQNFKYSASSEGFNRTLKLKDLVKLEEGENIEEEAPKKQKRGRPRKRK